MIGGRRLERGVMGTRSANWQSVCWASGLSASDVLVVNTKHDCSSPPIPRSMVMSAIERLLPHP